MAKTAEMKIIAHICTEFPEKFGIPRQSGLADTRATVVFEPEFQNPDALRGLEGYSHIWLLWQFSSALRARWLPTVRPPRLGGNARMGVFATRSPFRPSPIGLSSVRLCAVELQGARGPLLHVAGADLMDGTPILDIKPYLAYTDAHPDAASGFACAPENGRLAVDFPPGAFGDGPACAARGALRGACAGSAACLSGRARAGIRILLCRDGDPVFGGVGTADGQAGVSGGADGGRKFG